MDGNEERERGRGEGLFIYLIMSDLIMCNEEVKGGMGMGEQ